MYCGDPIINCNGCVLPRDVLAAWEGTLPAGQPMRELCQKFSCAEKWKEQLRQEDPEGNYDWI